MDRKDSITKFPPYTRVFVSNFIGGIGWVIGVAVGLTLLGSVLSILVSALGGLPYVGEQIAALISVTSNALLRTQN